jgi:hypothetical protein
MKEERTKRNQKLLKVATSGCISLKPCRVGREEMLGTGYVFLLDREMASASFNSDNNSICMHCQLGQSCYCSLHRSLSCPPLDLCFVVEPSQSL